MLRLLRLFGIGESRILKKDCKVLGTVTAVKRCWWVRMKTKPARLYASADNTVYAHIITFTYCVDNKSYVGKRYIDISYHVPQIGDSFYVYYDPVRPEAYACYSFGPGVMQTGW